VTVLMLGGRCRISGLVIQWDGALQGDWVIVNSVIGRVQSWVRLVDVWWAYSRPVNGSEVGVVCTIDGLWVGNAGLFCDGLDLVCG